MQRVSVIIPGVVENVLIRTRDIFGIYGELDNSQLRD
jgi:hypothetical protein